jgi:NitT/TauT family transport system substrate-binding protein
MHDLGFPETSGNIYAREDFLAGNKELVIAFLRGAAKSWQWTMDHPEEASKLLVEKYGVSGLIYDSQVAEIKASTPFIANEYARKNGLLSLDLANFEKVLETYRKAEIIKSDMKATDICDPQYIQAAYAKA